MDEILHAPQNELPLRRRRKDHSPSGAERVERFRERFSKLMTETAERSRVLRLQGTRVYHRAWSATAGKPKLSPLPFLAISAVVGVAAVVGTVYTPSYVVTVDGTDLGLVRNQAIFTQAMDRVEDRASEILGYEYQMEHTVSYTPALSERSELTPVADFENYLFDQISEITQGYVLTVDGQTVGAATDRAALDTLLEELSAPYVNENTFSVSYTKNVHITKEYFPSDTQQDTAAMMATLTANTNGQTTYEVQKGDTFMALAFDNGMTMSEMEALNPDVDVDRLYIGQILNIKEEIPFLGVQTVDALTYTEEIECPVREVEDDSMYQGESKVLDAGVPGEALVTADVTYVNGVERERNVTSSTAPSPPGSATAISSAPTATTPAWTSPSPTAPASRPPMAARWSPPAGRAATATWWSSTTATASGPTTATTPACWSRWATRSTRARSSPRPAPPDAPPATTATSKFGSTAPGSTPRPISPDQAEGSDRPP